MTAAKNLRALRGSKPREAIARDLGISYSSYMKYERGERVPRDDMKIKIAEYYGKSVGEIFFS